MKISNSRAYQPVTITFETEEEYDGLKKLISYLCETAPNSWYPRSSSMPSVAIKTFDKMKNKL